MIKIEEIFYIYPIYKEINKYLNWEDKINLSKTNKIFKKMFFMYNHKINSSKHLIIKYSKIFNYINEIEYTKKNIDNDFINHIPKTVKILNLSSCHINNLKRINKSKKYIIPLFNNLPEQIEILNISYCNIRSLNFLYRLNNLKRVYCSYIKNLITINKNDLPSLLEYIDISYCCYLKKIIVSKNLKIKSDGIILKYNKKIDNDFIEYYIDNITIKELICYEEFRENELL